MLLQGKFKAMKLTKKVRDGKVYRTLWIKDEFDDDLQISFKEDLLPKLKKNGVYLGTFEFSQFQKYEGYGMQDRVKLVELDELKEQWDVNGVWQI